MDQLHFLPIEGVGATQIAWRESGRIDNHEVCACHDWARMLAINLDMHVCVWLRPECLYPAQLPKGCQRSCS